jgi:hypothetical protein
VFNQLNIPGLTVGFFALHTVLSSQLGLAPTPNRWPLAVDCCCPVYAINFLAISAHPLVRHISGLYQLCDLDMTLLSSHLSW